MGPVGIGYCACGYGGMVYRGRCRRCRHTTPPPATAGVAVPGALRLHLDAEAYALGFRMVARPASGPRIDRDACAAWLADA